MVKKTGMFGLAAWKKLNILAWMMSTRVFFFRSLVFGKDTLKRKILPICAHIDKLGEVWVDIEDTIYDLRKLDLKLPGNVILRTGIVSMLRDPLIAKKVEDLREWGRTSASWVEFLSDEEIESLYEQLAVGVGHPLNPFQSAVLEEKLKDLDTAAKDVSSFPFMLTNMDPIIDELKACIDDVEACLRKFEGEQA